MKTYSKPSISKLVSSFDTELKNLLLQDLRAVKSAKNQLLESIEQSINAKSLAA
ncbi:hypothetical protein [Mucilaginibacter sp. PAMB04168]|uniref:hypothetical protein n=1 Tax=Mucilaginibacter sp. PAMB04168 TaxID=3138567 RepID=UPI0031F6E555